MILKVVALCVAAAMICSALRVQRPELAAAVSLAGGLAALTLLAGEVGTLTRWLDGFRALTRSNGDITATVLKGAGIAIASELGTQVCTDAGESALAGRIALASRVAMLALCAPLFSELSGRIGGALS